MQLASYGSKALAKARTGASSYLPKNHNPHLGSGGPSHVRSIHIPIGGAPRPQLLQSTAQKLFTQSRNVLTGLFAHLTAPSLIRAPPQGVNPSLLARRGLHHTSAKATIRNGLTYPTRMALSRPVFLPKGPGPIVNRSLAQVGLGTARNFCSSRPIFQNLVENVPVVGRALYEADLDITDKKLSGKENLRSLKRGKGKTSARKGQMMKPKDALKSVLLAPSSTAEESALQAEMDHYFTSATPARPKDVVTSLLIPLAPTPTSRTPLAEFPPSPSAHPSLLPRETLMEIHATHSLHSIRVSSLFQKLDVANVWNQGVNCSAYAHGTIGAAEYTDEARGASVCTVLKVEFVGWRKEEVRAVIGESGTGWCVLEEQRIGSSSASSLCSDEEIDGVCMDEDHHSETSSIISEDTSDAMSSMMDDEAISHSFVMPTLDFSSSFMSNISSPRERTASDADFSPPSSSYSSSDSYPIIVDPPSQNGYFPRHSSASSHYSPSLLSDSDWEDLPMV
jgi:hypothetical protein